MRYLILIWFVCSMLACQPSGNKTVPSNLSKDAMYNLPEWAKYAFIYEVNIRQYTEEGTINAFRKHLPRLKEMGVDILWFMPIYPISTTKKKGTLGSYYSVTNFLEINPEFGTMDDVDQLIQDIHELDMKIILDWVPNHTGWDHIWLKNHPEWYTQNDQGEIIDPHNDQGESHGWTDVADLNYSSSEMRAEMLDQLEWWVKEKNIDGYRMDIAFGVPDDFWQSVKERLYPIKPIFMLAESENDTHRNNKYFHSTYGWNLFHVMNDIAKGHKTNQDFINTHQENANKFTNGNTLIFTSNHDENAWNGTVFERFGEGAKGWAVIMGLLDGMPLIYSGMEEPMKKRLEFFEKDNIEFSDYKFSSFYQSLMNIKKEHPALHNLPYGAKAEWLDINDRILAFKRTSGESDITVLFNSSADSVAVSADLLVKQKTILSSKITGNSIGPFGFVVLSNK